MLTGVTQPYPTVPAPRPVAASVDELLAGAERRESFKPVDARSPAPFERVWFDGVPHVVKYVHLDNDVVMRSYGDVGCIPLRVWELGLMDLAPDIVDHAVVGAARGWGRNGWGAAILMRDAGDDLVPPGDDPLPEEQHLRFLDHLATLSARTLGWRDDHGLLPYATRWQMFGPGSAEAERALGFPEPFTRVAAEAWHTFAAQAPRDVARGISALRDDVTPLADALRTTPSAFLHGDWKLGNLGTARDGRTVLIDWTYCGEGPICHELAWYLALNRSRLPVGHTKETTIEAFRAALERHGVDTAPWWERQLDLCLVAMTVHISWIKVLEEDAEFGWWCDRAREGLARL